MGVFGRRSEGTIVRHEPWWSEHQHLLIGLAVFAIAFVILLWLQADPTFADPDSFYHAKVALLIRDQGIFRQFPWLQFTVLKEHYTDQHFLYHVFLIPFVSAMNPIAGVKLATVLLASAVVVALYAVLHTLRVRFSAAYAILLLAVTPFTFRMSLAKAPSVSLLFLLIGILLLIRGKTRLLAVWSFIYVWAYGGFALLLIVAGAWALVNIISTWVVGRREGKKKASLTALRVPAVKHAGAVLAGMIAGIVVNPFFPGNLAFYWSQLVQIGIINYRSVIGVGNEWYPYPFMELAASTVFLSVIVVIGLALLFIFARRQPKASWMLFLLALFFFLLTLKSKRYVEYYVPFGMLFGASSISAGLRFQDVRRLLEDVTAWYFRHKIFASILIVYFIVTLPTIAVRDLERTKQDLAGGSNVNRFIRSSTWLKEHTPQGSIVFHSSWDEFPILFYHNAHNYYIVGLDPTFMYEYNKDLYQKMVDITTGANVPDAERILRNEFHASYVFIEKSHSGMKSILDGIPSAHITYQDTEATIYALE